MHYGCNTQLFLVCSFVFLFRFLTLFLNCVMTCAGDGNVLRGIDIPRAATCHVVVSAHICYGTLDLVGQWQWESQAADSKSLQEGDREGGSKALSDLGVARYCRELRTFASNTAARPRHIECSTQRKRWFKLNPVKLSQIHL